MQNWKKKKFPIFQRHTKFIILVTFKHAALIGLPLLHFFYLRVDRLLVLCCLEDNNAQLYKALEILAPFHHKSSSLCN